MALDLSSADPVGAAIAGANTLLDLLTRVYNAYSSVGDQIDTWSSREESLKALMCLVKEVAKAAPPGSDMQLAATELDTKLKQALKLVDQLRRQRQASNALTRLQHWNSTRKDVQKAKQALDNICEAAERYTRAAAVMQGASQSAALGNISAEQLKARRAAIVQAVDASLSQQFAPGGFMLLLQQQYNKMPADYPLPIFTTPAQVELRSKMLQGMKELWPVMKAFGKCIEEGILNEAFFKTEGKNLLHQAKKYRMLVEPLEVCNWYWRTKHIRGSGHYADGIADTPSAELNQDNRKRPGRYVQIQRMEKAVLGSAASSLRVARRLQQDAGLAAQVAAVADWDAASSVWIVLLRAWFRVCSYVQSLLRV